MAEASISWTEDQFRCSVCLDLLKDPVTIPCGHTYCMCCISECWDQEDWKGFYSCPQCRQIFSPRPVLYKNVVFAEMVEKLKKTRLLAAFPVVHHAGSGDVQCDSCTGIKQKAVKSCLECLISYCQTHLEQHESLFRDQKHNLMDATGRLQELICSQHNKLLEIYCRTDQQCICMLCFVDEHKNHDTVSTAAERKEKQRDFEETQNKFQKLIHQREKDLQELRVAVDSHKSSAQTAVEDSERVFTELIRSIEKRLSEVKQLIRDQERAAVSRAEEQLERLKKEIDDLKRKDTELQQLSETQDHVHFLQSWPSVCLTGSTDSFTVSARDIPFDDVVKSVSQLRDKLQQFCTDEIENISKTVKTVQIIQTPEYDTRKEFLQYFHQLSLDPNTVHPCLHLSEGNTVITYTNTYYGYPDHPERFDYAQALCRESVTGRCYWELEYSGSAGVYVAVAYKSIRRKGQSLECAFGCNNQSWILFSSPSKCSFSHNNINCNLPLVSSNRIGVFVDHSAGTLSFYSVSDTMSLIHRVQTTFTQPLYPGFGLGLYSTSKLCRLRN
ncbi:E3 ubiquitin/ISG15 ligase TRIM25-like isoform X3 [Carassius gibelio]|uniref:E3 ubiquitin/ISG15 ligase TRIM25-like isoform X3 n=1 Tax=Carassius gibelio TaxID=101364 RepID=UPI0022798F43|nr:E3 ubiquitin/ISG15 ligase TRIM25-like isoform X3 [Carassius gibelio]